MTTSTPTSSLDEQLSLVEIKPGLQFSLATLKAFLPDVETALFFGKVYELDYVQLSNLLSQTLDSVLADELFSGSHSEQLQGYILDLTAEVGAPEEGEVSFSPGIPPGEVLPELWKSMEVEVAQSIKDAASKLTAVMSRMPGKQGEMLFKTMAKVNARRPTIGDFRPFIHHKRSAKNLVILDVSGSMTEETVTALLDDVIALSYMADAHLAIVSDTCFTWEPGNYDGAAVLKHAEFNGTRYEQLKDLMNQDWDTVVTIADYDSSQWAKDYLWENCAGSIEKVIDISLVPRPTFLAECVGQFAKEVQPILVANPASCNSWSGVLQ